MNLETECCSGIYPAMTVRTAEEPLKNPPAAKSRTSVVGLPGIECRLQNLFTRKIA